MIAPTAPHGHRKWTACFDTGLVTPKSYRFEFRRILGVGEIDQLELEAKMFGFLEIVRTIKRALRRA